MRALPVFLAILALQGCYVSDEPILGASADPCPINETTDFGVAFITPASDDGRRQRVQVHTTGDGRCRVQIRAGNADLAFQRLGDAWLVQGVPDAALASHMPTGGRALYVVARREGDAWILAIPDCDHEVLREMEQQHSEAGDGLCTVSNADTLTGMFSIYADYAPAFAVLETYNR